MTTSSGAVHNWPMPEGLSIIPRGQGLWFHLVILLTIGGMVSLSVWQFHRLAWKRGVIAEIESHWAAPVIPLAALEKLPVSEWAWRRVALPAAITAPDEGAATLTATQGNQFGQQALMLTADGHWLVVGPWQLRDRAYQKRPAPAMALVKPVQPTAPFAPKNDPADNAWYQIDGVMLQHFAPRMTTTHYLQILSAEAASAAPVLPNNNHLQYALTWAALALVISSMYVHLLQQRRKQNKLR